MKLADGFSYSVLGTLAGQLTDPVLRFPVLAYWSFTCDEGGDFQYLAERVQVRMLGHVVTGQETPDGDGAPPGGSPAAAPEPPPTRPLPLVTPTGHVQIDHLSREGEPSPAWFRGPLAPAAVPRAEPPAPGQPPPLAHHADQLRRVTPDGQEDLGYAAAFEVGRLLALSQPGVAAALARWRAEAYGAARVQQVVADAMGSLPAPVAAGLNAADPLTDPALATRPRTLGARASRTLVGLLGADPGAALGPARPVAAPGNAARPAGPGARPGHGRAADRAGRPRGGGGQRPGRTAEPAVRGPGRGGDRGTARGRGPGAGGGPGRRAAGQPGGRGRGPGRRGRDRVAPDGPGGRRGGGPGRGAGRGAGCGAGRGRAG